MKCFVAGGAGFIGSNLTRRLLRDGHGVTVFDNLSFGKKEFLNEFQSLENFSFVKGDLCNMETLDKYLRDYDIVFHFAASSDISLGGEKTDLDLKNGFLSTFNILECMRRNSIKKIVFASSGSVYGESSINNIHENVGPILPLSLYAASKVASEAYISAFCSIYPIKGWLFRFANIIGPNATHGVVFDFIRKLKKTPKHLQILGDGNQRKPYLYVEECIDGILHAISNSDDDLNYFNLSCEGTVDVKSIANIVVEVMGLKGVKFSFVNEDAAWPGDQKFIQLDPGKINALGWIAKMKSEEAVYTAAKKILEQNDYN